MPQLKITALRNRSAIQLSRKYRLIGVPPELPEGKTFLDLLRERDPLAWQHVEDRARELIVQMDRSTHIELTVEEFNEWLAQRGCAPLDESS